MNCQLLLANFRIPYGNIIKFDATKMFNCSIHSIKFGLDNRVTRFSIFLKSHYLGYWRKNEEIDHLLSTTKCFRMALKVGTIELTCTETLCTLYRNSRDLLDGMFVILRVFGCFSFR